MYNADDEIKKNKKQYVLITHVCPAEGPRDYTRAPGSKIKMFIADDEKKLKKFIDW